MILFTPKRYLRAKEAYSSAEELTGGHFLEVLDDPEPRTPSRSRRVVLATGKVALDLLGERDRLGREDVAVVRIEQLYPWPADLLAGTVAALPRGPRRWCGCKRSRRTWAPRLMSGIA